MIFVIFGLTRPGTEPESTISVADTLSHRAVYFHVIFTVLGFSLSFEACSENSSWTPWYTRDTSTGNCVCQLHSALRIKNPSQICENPTGVQARLANGKVPNNQDGTTPNAGLGCCDSGDMNCQDYEVRFCCPLKGNSSTVQFSGTSSL